jgi:hypothetical protein
LVVILLISIWLEDCYTQLATNSDDQTSVVNASPNIDQSVQENQYPLPYYPLEPSSEYPHPIPIPPTAGEIPHETIIDSPSSPPNRQSGYERGPASTQGTSHQIESTPPRTSWSPAPASPSSAQPTNSSGPVRTSGSTRGGR